MKHTKFFIILSAILSIAFASCKVAETETEYVPVKETEYVTVTDTEAPASVSNAKSSAGDGMVLLSWVNPSNGDFYATRISFSPAAENVVNPLVVEGTANTATTALIKGLSNGTEYTFTLVALDSSRNVSSATTVSATPVDASDHTAPADVTNLVATASGTKVLLTWIDASDDDIFGYEVSYSGNSAINRAAINTMDSNTIFVAPRLGGTYISGLSAGTYTFTVKSMDTSGNKSSGAASEKVTVTAASQASCLSIVLTPSTTEPAKSVDVSVSVVEPSENDTVSKISYKSGLSYKASDVLSSGTDITTEKSFSVSENGSFTVAAMDSSGRREIEWISISNIDETAPAAVTGLLASYSSSDKKITLTWNASSASDFDHYLVSYSVDGTEKLSDVEVRDATTYTLSDISADDKSYTFTVKAVDKAGNESEESSASVKARAPKFTSITIPRAGTAENGNYIDAIVYGENFKIPDIDLSKFILDCDSSIKLSGSQLTVKNNTILYWTLGIPETAGSYSVKISYDDESITGTFNVIDSGKYKAGQILLADGSLVESDSYSSIDTSNPPVAVVTFDNINGVYLGVGLHKSATKLAWAKEDTTGCKTEFTDIACNQSPYTNDLKDATFTGDTDGSNNWDVICTVDPDGSKNAAENYPAFNWANTYGETYKDYLGGVTTGWYMPTIAEFYGIEENLTAINNALSHISSLENGSAYADSVLEDKQFFSASQNSEKNSAAWWWSQGNVDYFEKYWTYYVLVIRKLNL